MGRQNPFREEGERIRREPLRLLLHLSVLAALVLNLWLVQYHEPVRDEAQSWLIARDTGPLAIFQVLSYEGHPVLWYYLLMPFAKLGFPYGTCRVLSQLLTAGVILTLAYRSPFCIPMRAALVLSGLTLYRCACFGRSYALLAFLTVRLCCRYGSRHEKPLPYVLLIAALIQTHLLAIGFAFGLCAAYLVEELAAHRRPFASLVRRLLPLLLPLASALLLLFELRDVSSADVMQVRSRPLPPFFRYCASSSLTTLLGKAAPVFIVLLLLFVLLLLLCRRRFAAELATLLLAWLAAAAVLSTSVSPAFYRVMPLGFFFVWFLWSLREKAPPLPARTEVPARRAALPDLLLRLCGTALLLVFLAGIDYAVLYGSENGNLVQDIRYVYSDSRGAAAAIAALPEDAVVVESLEDVCNAVVAFLPPGRIVNPFLDEPASYANRNRDLPHRMSWNIFQRYCHRSFRGKEEFYLLYTPACAIKGLPVEAFEVVYEPQGEVATSEWFKLLRIPVS